MNEIARIIIFGDIRADDTDDGHTGPVRNSCHSYLILRKIFFILLIFFLVQLTASVHEHRNIE